MGSLFGAGGTKAAAKANQTGAQLASQQAALAQEQWQAYKPLVDAFVQGQLANYGLAQPYMAPLLQHALARLTGAPLMGQLAVPGISPTPGMSQVSNAPSGGGETVATMSPMEQVGAALDQALGTTDAAQSGWSPGSAFPGVGQNNQPRSIGQIPLAPTPGQTVTPTPAAPAAETTPTPSPAQPPLAAGAVSPFPQATGPFDYDLERAAWERARTDIERAGAQGLAGLQSALGSRFGGSASAGSLAAGAGAELQSKMNEALIGARLGIAQQQQAVEDQRFQQVAQMLGALSGVNVGPATAAGQTAVSGLGQASSAYTQAAQAYAQQAAQKQQALGNALFSIGSMFAGGFGLPSIGTAAVGSALAPTLTGAAPLTASGLGLTQPSQFWNGGISLW